MRRREFITLLGGTVATWPLAAGAQQRSGPVRRVGVLDTLSSDDPFGQERVGAFLQGLQQAGWSIGENVQVDTRWGSGRPDNLRKHAAELVALAPDVIMTTGSGLDLLRQVTQAIPIVFVVVPDPVGAGFVESLARPGGNVTGFTQAEYSMGIKSLELLKQLAPYITRLGVIRATTPSGIGQFGAIQGAASSFGVDLFPLGERDAAEIERSVSAFARGRNDGLIVASGASATLHRNLIVTLAARHKLPAAYPARFFTAAGGLISYGAERLDPYRRAAGYVDRILKGEKPADLPVQAPTKYELVINLKAAKALGITVPPTLLARADEVIE